MPSKYFADALERKKARELTNAGAGRPKGSHNKTHAVVRWGLTEAYRRLGGVDGLVKWAEKDNANRTAFYQLWSKLIPAEVRDADREAESQRPVRVLILPPGQEQAQAQAIDITPKVPAIEDGTESA